MFRSSIVITVQKLSSLRFCLDDLSARSTTVRMPSTVDFSLRRPNCIFDRPYSPSVYLPILLNIIHSRSFPHASNRYIGLYDAGSPEGFPGFGNNTSFWIYHLSGKVSSSRQFWPFCSLSISANARIAFFKATLGIASGPGGFLISSRLDAAPNSWSFPSSFFAEHTFWRLYSLRNSGMIWIYPDLRSSADGAQILQHLK